jgi:hypothetical protein
MNPFNPYAKPMQTVGLSKRGKNAHKGGTTIGGSIAPQAAPPQQDPSMMGSAMMQGPPQLGEKAPWQLQQGQANMPMLPPVQPATQPAAPDPGPNFAKIMAMLQPRQQGGVDPNMKALMDAMTGARVHKGMDGRQIGQEGVDPNLKYMLYAMRGRRHKGMDGKDIY